MCMLGATAVLAGPVWDWESMSDRRVARARAPSVGGESEADPSDEIQYETDSAWHLLKSYSLLTVRDSCGSIHRLLQAVIQGNHRHAQQSAAVSVCVATLRRLWLFDTADSETWRAAGVLVEHIKVVGRQAAALGMHRLEMAQLLTGTASYYSVVLSQFGEAQECLQQGLTLQSAAATRDDCLLLDMAQTMHELGKVLRYRGKLGPAEQYLRDALRIHQQADHATKRKRVAEVLHELGVLYVKRHELPTAEQYLLRSKELKQCLLEEEAPGSATADLAATLHQLAVVATNTKPARLDEAEALLQEALRLEMLSVVDTGKPATARASFQLDDGNLDRVAVTVDTAAGTACSTAVASTLQQLARVSIRRGQLDAARTYLDRALRMQQAVYRSDLHVNVASTEHQLGIVARTKEDWAAASKHFLNALRIRRAMYHTQGDHPEVSATLHELGKLSKLQGRSDDARRYLDEEQGILSRLLQGRDGQGLGARGAGQEWLLLQGRITGMCYLRSLARELGDRDAAAAHSATIKQLKSRLQVLRRLLHTHNRNAEFRGV